MLLALCALSQGLSLLHKAQQHASNVMDVISDGKFSTSQVTTSRPASREKRLFGEVCGQPEPTPVQAEELTPGTPVTVANNGSYSSVHFYTLPYMEGKAFSLDFSSNTSDAVLLVGLGNQPFLQDAVESCSGELDEATGRVYHTLCNSDLHLVVRQRYAFYNTHFSLTVSYVDETRDLSMDLSSGTASAVFNVSNNWDIEEDHEHWFSRMLKIHGAGSCEKVSLTIESTMSESVDDDDLQFFFQEDCPLEVSACSAYGQHYDGSGLEFASSSSSSSFASVGCGFTEAELRQATLAGQLANHDVIATSFNNGYGIQLDLPCVDFGEHGYFQVALPEGNTVEVTGVQGVLGVEACPTGCAGYSACSLDAAAKTGTCDCPAGFDNDDCSRHAVAASVEVETFGDAYTAAVNTEGPSHSGVSWHFDVDEAESEFVRFELTSGHDNILYHIKLPDGTEMPVVPRPANHFQVLDIYSAYGSFSFAFCTKGRSGEWTLVGVPTTAVNGFAASLIVDTHEGTIEVDSGVQGPFTFEHHGFNVYKIPKQPSASQLHVVVRQLGEASDLGGDFNTALVTDCQGWEHVSSTGYGVFSLHEATALEAYTATIDIQAYAGNCKLDTKYLIVAGSPGMDYSVDVTSSFGDFAKCSLVGTDVCHGVGVCGSDDTCDCSALHEYSDEATCTPMNGDVDEEFDATTDACPEGVEFRALQLGNNDVSADGDQACIRYVLNVTVPFDKYVDMRASPEGCFSADMLEDRFEVYEYLINDYSCYHSGENETWWGDHGEVTVGVRPVQEGSLSHISITLEDIPKAPTTLQEFQLESQGGYATFAGPGIFLVEVPSGSGFTVHVENPLVPDDDDHVLYDVNVAVVNPYSYEEWTQMRFEYTQEYIDMRDRLDRIDDVLNSMEDAAELQCTEDNTQVLEMSAPACAFAETESYWLRFALNFNHLYIGSFDDDDTPLPTFSFGVTVGDTFTCGGSDMCCGGSGACNPNGTCSCFFEGTTGDSCDGLEVDFSLLSCSERDGTNWDAPLSDACPSLDKYGEVSLLVASDEVDIIQDCYMEVYAHTAISYVQALDEDAECRDYVSRAYCNAIFAGCNDDGNKVIECFFCDDEATQACNEQEFCLQGLVQKPSLSSCDPEDQGDIQLAAGCAAGIETVEVTEDGDLEVRREGDSAAPSTMALAAGAMALAVVVQVV